MPPMKPGLDEELAMLLQGQMGQQGQNPMMKAMDAVAQRQGQNMQMPQGGGQPLPPMMYQGGSRDPVPVPQGGGVPMPRPRYPNFDPNANDQRAQGGEAYGGLADVPPGVNLRRNDQRRQLDEVVQADDMLGGVRGHAADMAPNAAPGQELSDEEMIDYVMKEPHPDPADMFVGKLSTDVNTLRSAWESDYEDIDNIVQEFIKQHGEENLPEEISTQRTDSSTGP